MARITTQQANERFIPTVLFADEPAGKAALRGVTGIDPDDCPTGTRSLERQHLEQLSPPGIVNRPGQTRTCMLIIRVGEHCVQHAVS